MKTGLLVLVFGSAFLISNAENENNLLGTHTPNQQEVTSTPYTISLDSLAKLSAPPVEVRRKPTQAPRYNSDGSMSQPSFQVNIGGGSAYPPADHPVAPPVGRPVNPGRPAQDPAAYNYEDVMEFDEFEFHKFYPGRDYYGYSHRPRRPQYVITSNAVVYDGRAIYGADPHSFTILPDGYATDRWRVYYDGAEISRTNTGNFAVLGWGYAKDTWHVYYKGMELRSVTPSNFTVLDWGYAKDNWNVYYKGSKLEGASPESFTVLNRAYAKDNWRVYYFGKVMPGVSATGFCLLGHGYAKDNWHVYYNGKQMNGVSVDGFKVLSDGYAEDGWRTYYRGTPVN